MSGNRADAAGVPSLDELAGDWMPLAIVASMPDVHNFNQMLVVNRDLTSFVYPRHASVDPLVTMTLDGVAYPATDARWYAYRALRRNVDCAGLSVESDTRLVNEQQGVLCRIKLTNTTKLAREVQLALRVPGKLDEDGTGVVSTKHLRTAALQPSRRPDATTVEGDAVVWHWKLELPAGASTAVGFVAAEDDNANLVETRQKAVNWAGNFDAQMADFQAVWEKRWSDAFTPGNTHFSGNLPTLKTEDAALRRNYYMGALTMLVLERTQFPIPRAFITSGERADGIQYFWDASMTASAWALLEPVGMKAVLRRWLVQNPRSSFNLLLHDTAGFDAMPYAAMKGYATNACTIFLATDTYLRLTGDHAFLDEKLENGKTVLGNLDALATDWETLPKGPEGLVDYGDRAQLLETPYLYVQCVAAVNAQNVWMMRKAADWQALKGNDGRAGELRDKATAFLPAVLSLYNQESGAWNLRLLDGTTVPVQHCFDYIYVANALKDDLTAAEKLGMNEFAKRELFTHDWMRAMSLKDPDFPKAQRPDHAYTGAYDGWIPLTAGAMWRLGDTRDAYDFYCRAADVTKEGPFAQAHEFYGPTPTSNDAPVRIALRGGNMKECISGVAFTDVVINTFFGLMPSIDGKELLVDAKTPRPFTGTLQNVRLRKTLYTISADATGLQLIKQ